MYVIMRKTDVMYIITTEDSNEALKIFQRYLSISAYHEPASNYILKQVPTLQLDEMPEMGYKEINIMHYFLHDHLYPVGSMFYQGVDGDMFQIKRIAIYNVKNPSIAEFKVYFSDDSFIILSETVNLFFQV